MQIFGDENGKKDPKWGKNAHINVRTWRADNEELNRLCSEPAEDVHSR